MPRASARSSSSIATAARSSPRSAGVGRARELLEQRGAHGGLVVAQVIGEVARIDARALRGRRGRARRPRVVAAGGLGPALERLEIDAAGILAPVRADAERRGERGLEAARGDLARDPPRHRDRDAGGGEPRRMLERHRADQEQHERGRGGAERPHRAAQQHLPARARRGRERRELDLLRRARGRERAAPDRTVRVPAISDEARRERRTRAYPSDHEERMDRRGGRQAARDEQARHRGDLEQQQHALVPP